MAERYQLACPVMRGRTGFNADQTRLQRLKEAQNFVASQLPADSNGSTCINAVDLEPVLGEVKADGGNLNGGRLLSFVAFTDDHVVAHIDAASRGRPPHQNLCSAYRPALGAAQHQLGGI